jgi:hypothetical protein
MVLIICQGIVQEVSAQVRRQSETKKKKSVGEAREKEKEEGEGGFFEFRVSSRTWS